jgi:hypothetical protein
MARTLKALRHVGFSATMETPMRRRNAAAIATIYGKPPRSRKREQAQRAKRLLTLLPLVAATLFVANIANILWK